MFLQFLNDVRDFFWPLLEGAPRKMFAGMKSEDMSQNVSYLSEEIRLFVELYEREMARAHIVEEKGREYFRFSGVFVSSFLLSFSVIVVVGSEVVDVVYSIFFLMMALYVSRVAWFSSKSLKRNQYKVISTERYANIENVGVPELQKRLSEVKEALSHNSYVINEKVDYVEMSRAYFKRIFVVLILATLANLFLIVCKLLELIR